MKKNKLNKYLSKLSLAVLVIAGIYCIYIPSKPLTSPVSTFPTPERTALLSSTASPPVTSEQIESWHLFGTFSKATMDFQSQKDYQETSLPISIKGLFSNAKGDGWAIISVNNKGEEIFRKGMQIKPGIRIERLENSYAIISNKGLAEKLALSEFSNAQAEGIKRTVEGDIAQASKEEGDKEQSGILQAIRKAGLRRVSKESASGYLVIGENNKANRQFNLKKGDVVKSVNGYPVGSDSADVLAFETYKSSGKANVEISRSGQTIYLEYPL